MDDGRGWFCPDEGGWLLVPARDVGGDVLTKLPLAQEFRRTQRLLREDAKKAFNLVEPRGARRSVVKVDARVFSEPGHDLGRAVR